MFVTRHKTFCMPAIAEQDSAGRSGCVMRKYPAPQACLSQCNEQQAPVSTAVCRNVRAGCCPVGKMEARGDWGEEGAMTGAGRKGQSENLAPRWTSESQLSPKTPKARRRQLQELSQPLPTNNSRNVAAAIQILLILLPNSKCPPRLPPTSASTYHHLSPPTLNTSASKYTTTRRARQRPLLTIPLTNPLTPPPSPQTPTPSRPTGPNKRPNKETLSPST